MFLIKVSIKIISLNEKEIEKKPSFNLLNN